MTREQLTAILTATRSDALQLDDGSYLDWSTTDGHSIALEVGDADGQAVTLTLDRHALTELVNRFAATLLAD